jgi:signal transduction histidine kinase
VPAAQRQRTYEILSSETERLHGLVEELLDFARMEAGAVNYRMEPLEPGELLASLVAGFQQQVAPQGYRVEFSAPEELPVIRGDREALTRAVRNLLDNAVKYSPECRTVWVEAERQDARVAVRVRDCGVGIPAAERKEIFKKFVRGKGPGVGRVKGTGIGLAMVAHVVRAHGGEVRVESEPGQGSTFTLLLPMKEAA